MGTRRKVLLGIGMFSASVIVVVMAAWLVMSSRANAKLGAEMEKLKQSGGTADIAELVPPIVPDSDNAAIHLENSFKALAKPDDKEKNSLEAIEKDSIAASAEDASAAQAWVDRNSAAMELVNQAFSCGSCRFNLDYSAGVAMKIPGMTDLKLAWRLVHAKALLDARAGRTEEAFRGVGATLHGTAICLREPILIVNLIRMGLVGKSLDRLASLMNVAAPGPDTASSISSALDSLDIKESMKKAMLGERCFGVSAFNTVASGDRKAIAALVSSEDSSGGFKTGAFAAAPRFLLRLDQAEYMRRMREILEASSLPYAEARVKLEAMEAEKLPWYSMVTSMMLPGLKRVISGSESIAARIALAKVALVLRTAYSPQSGFPEKYDAIPADPFTGRPILYKRLNSDSCIVYSTGPDGVDNGGKESDSEEDGADIVWALKIGK